MNIRNKSGLSVADVTLHFLIRYTTLCVRTRENGFLICPPLFRTRRRSVGQPIVNERRTPHVRVTKPGLYYDINVFFICICARRHHEPAIYARWSNINNHFLFDRGAPSSALRFSAVRISNCCEQIRSHFDVRDECCAELVRGWTIGNIGLGM